MEMPQSNSPGESSPDSFEGNDDHPLHTSMQWQAQQDDQQHPSPSATSSPSSQLPRAAPPIQKRRRVTRACDECRRKKIKCDGKQPCTHCTVYSYDCTYDQPSNRRRNPAPQYIEALEARLQRAEALLRTYNPAIDLNDPSLDHLMQTPPANVNSEAIRGVAAQPKAKVDQLQNETSKDAQLQSMIESTGQLDIDEQGYWDFHGGSSGAVFLRRMRQEFRGLLGGDSSAPFLPRPPRPAPPVLDSPRSTYDSPHEGGLPNTIDLPTRELARVKCANALTCACAILRFVHQPSFYQMVDRIYDTPADEFGDDENRFLPLLYAVLAVGCMFAEDPQTPQLGDIAYKASLDQGYKYFRAARQMMDIAEIRDMTSLQAILFMILFLQCSSNLSTCYSYIGVALRSAIRMGLHRNISTNFNPIERESRRRVFWIVRKMDTYVSALLGFPRLLSDEDIDQELPMEVDDEFITNEGILPMPEGRVSLYAASNAHTKLMGILAKVIKYIYPIRGVEQCAKDGSNPSYVISHVKIREVERDLQDWLDRLPMALRPGGYTDEQVVRSQQLLRMAYAHVQMMLYRPFLHYVSAKSNTGKTIDDRSYACAAACVSVSRNIVHITAEMKRRGLLIGAYWFTMYTTFFAILSLVFFVLENPDKTGSKEILADASAGRDALRGLARRSLAADRCSASLGVLFERLPENLKHRSAEPPLSKKKRSAPPANASAGGEVSNTLDLTNSSQSPGFGKIQRATTFPTPVNAAVATSQRASFESPRYPQSAISNRHSQSLQDLISPLDTSGAGTPDSNNSSSMPFGYQQQLFLGNNSLPDLSAMMFPSADPFAYPNQPMMEFDDRRQKSEDMTNLLEGSTAHSNLYLSNGTSAQNHNPYDNLEGQIFGPLPPYLVQNQGPQAVDLSGIDMNGVPGVNPSEMSRHQLFPQHNVGLNFDEIFAGNNEEWNSMLGDQSYRP